jgi:hypothetical protein
MVVLPSIPDGHDAFRPNGSDWHRADHPQCSACAPPTRRLSATLVFTSRYGLQVLFHIALHRENIWNQAQKADDAPIRLRCVTQPDAAQAALLDRLGVVLPKRMRLAQVDWPTLAATA